MTTNIENFWDKSSRDYRYKQWEKSAVAESDFISTKDMLIESLRPDKNDSVLEIGCGPGKWTKIMSEFVKKITAVDISNKMINEAKKYCNNPKIKFLHGHVMKLDLKEKFDKIYAVRVFEYIQDKESFIRKMKLLLKEDGKLVVITKNKPCLWDLTKKPPGFWQEKISSKEFTEKLKSNQFENIQKFPVIIRLPIFSNGNREFPLIGTKLENHFLAFFRFITDLFRNSPETIRNLSILFSESYLIFAEKPRPSKL